DHVVIARLMGVWVDGLMGVWVDGLMGAIVIPDLINFLLKRFQRIAADDEGIINLGNRKKFQPVAAHDDYAHLIELSELI
ncbi:MAG: hypothetical protein KDH97_18905, partial [Calditrichaeota bacterium]|nr:hypothetical protein [Calditrichota bacterium]